MRPLIGLTTYREQAKWGVWDQPADLLPVMYADAIVRAGGVPVLLPPATDDPDAAAADGRAASTGWWSAVAPTSTRTSTARNRTRGPPRGDRTATRGSSPC